MSTPPPGGWQPPQHPGPHSNQGQPYGQPGYNPQQPPPGWQQGNWPQQPGPPPPQKGNSVRWLLIGVAVLLVIGITVGATLLFTRDNGGGGTSPTPDAPGAIASANDKGPVSVITEEPTCDSYMSINNSIANLEGQGWGDQRNNLGPASDWTPEQRRQVEAVATGIRKAADQIVPLVRQTPHRLVREMYEQFIVYGRAYADSIPNYTPDDNYLASANVNFGTALFAMCNAITYGSATRALGVAEVKPPDNIGSAGDPAAPSRFLTSSDDSACKGWVERESKFVAATADWAKLDAAIPASDWTPDQRATQQAVLPILSAESDSMASAGQDSGNSVLQDFAVAGAVYLKAYLTAGDTYVKADGWLSNVAFRLNNAVSSACQAPGR